MPPGVAGAAWELISGALAADPWRVGKPLHGPYEGLHTARRGTYRVICKIDEAEHAIEIRAIRYRADAYRTSLPAGTVPRLTAAAQGGVHPVRGR